MAVYSIDLHNHMPVPDADYRGPMDTSGHDVVRAAVAAGVDALGVSDHFSLGFFRHVHAAAVGTDLLVLPGAEVRLSLGEDEAHLIAVFPPDRAEERFSAFMDVLGFVEHARVDRLHRVVVEFDPVEAAKAISGLDGICVVAHVDRWFGEYRLLGSPLLRRLVDESPCSALEFVDLGNAAMLGGSASSVSLVQSSDSHHVDEIGRRASAIEARALSFEAIREALCAGASKAVAGS
jgi:PHP family Zn ribbon phosphoesterase